MYQMRRKARKLYRNVVKFVLLISFLIVGVTILNNYSSSPLKLPGIVDRMKDLDLPKDDKQLPLWDWITSWGLPLVLTILLVVGLIKFVPEYRKRKRVKRSNIQKVDWMSGDQFEDYLVILFKYMGYKAKKTKRTRDHGADVIIKLNGTTTVVQAKRERSKISNSAVQQVVASKAMYNAEEAWVVTNSYYTDPAKVLAKANNVELWDRDRLIKEMAKMYSRK